MFTKNELKLYNIKMFTLLSLKLFIKMGRNQIIMSKL
jgi:hypothetical protein